MDCPTTSDNHNSATDTVIKSRVDKCFVPMCPSTSTKFPNKLFLSGPSNPKLRKKWFQAVKTDFNYSPKTTIRCCEDHFDLENDVENWMKFKLTGGKLYLKKNVVPHIFECQNRMMPLKRRSAVMKRKRREILDSIEIVSVSDPLECSPITETQDSQNVEISNDKSVQAAIYTHKRSKQIQVEITIPQNTVDSSPNHKTSPVRLNLYELTYSSDSESLKTLCKLEEDTGSTSESELNECEIANKILLRSITMGRIMARPNLYIGILSSSILDEVLQRHMKCKLHHTCLVLKKLRLNESFSILAEDFDLHETTASRIFTKTCKEMAQVLKKFIINPSPETVLANLPNSFKNSYSQTYCIDCLEIEIEVPSDAIHQSLTYSSSKKNNTLKYLISSTPDGFINYVSAGFGGRTSDSKLLEDSGFLDILPPGACILVTRGFKHIEGLLAKKQMQLIRPPSATKSSIDVLRSKEFPSLKSHIERVFGGLREFGFLKPHACVENFLIANLNDAVIICSALVNLQSPLIKME